MKVIPLLVSCGITGFESPATEYKEMGLSLDQLLIANPNATFIGKASGDSMQGVGIFDGDLLIVDRVEPITNGCIVVACYNGEFVCKALDRVKRELVSANDKHAPIKISAADNVQLEGVVTRSIRMHKASTLI